MTQQNASTELRDAIFGALANELATHGLRKARMGRIAEAAGCARATLYRYHPTKEALLEDYAISIGRESMERIRAQVQTMPERRERIVLAVVMSVRFVLDDPRVKPFLAPDAQAFMTALPSRHATFGAELLSFFLTDVLSHEPEPSLKLPIPEALELCVRFILSLALIPLPPRDEAMLTDFVTRTLLPALFGTEGP